MNTYKAKIRIDSELTECTVDNRLFGSFVEHLGRAIYGGVFQPEHASADEQGFRADVLKFVRELQIPVIRYPGGNYVSAYKWEDSVGPVGDRPKRMDLAWKAIEPNTVGLNEFYDWAQKAGSDVMMAINLGTRGIDDARNLVEYCNHSGGLFWSDLRKKHGREKPYNFRVWCLGNEMDGPWQIGFKTADEYGKLAEEVAKALKLFDPTLELVVCGSSGPGMPTFPQWEATVLEHCYEHVDYISLHTYAKKERDDLESFLAESVRFENFITSVENTVEFVKAKKRSRKTVKLSVDEWNVWYHSDGCESETDEWQVGRKLLEDIYTMEDALVVGCFLIVLLRHAKSVRMACLAQLVNTIAPIMAEKDGPAWRQTIFYPFLHCSRYGRGEVLQTVISSETYHNDVLGDIPYLEAVGILHRDRHELVFFCVNRHATKDLLLEVKTTGFTDLSVCEHLVLAHPDPLACNSATEPEKVLPIPVNTTTVTNDALSSTISPLSWNVIRVRFGSME